MRGFRDEMGGGGHPSPPLSRSEISGPPRYRRATMASMEDAELDDLFLDDGSDDDDDGLDWIELEPFETEPGWRRAATWVVARWESLLFWRPDVEPNDTLRRGLEVLAGSGPEAAGRFFDGERKRERERAHDERERRRERRERWTMRLAAVAAAASIWGVLD